MILEIRDNQLSLKGKLDEAKKELNKKGVVGRNLSVNSHPYGSINVVSPFAIASTAILPRILPIISDASIILSR